MGREGLIGTSAHIQVAKEALQNYGGSKCTTGAGSYSAYSTPRIEGVPGGRYTNSQIQWLLYNGGSDCIH